MTRAVTTAVRYGLTTAQVERSLERDAKDPAYVKLYADAVRQAERWESPKTDREK